MAKKSAEKRKGKDNKLEVARLEEILFRAGYINKKDLLIQNFLRGIFFAVGSVIGATLVIALLLWILSLFDTFPLIGPIIEDVQGTIEQAETVESIE